MSGIRGGNGIVKGVRGNKSMFDENTKRFTAEKWILGLVAVGVLLAFIFVLNLPWIAIKSSWFQSQDAAAINERVGRLGIYGDMFGMLNCLFTGLALIGIAYAASLQREEVKLQQDEINDLKQKEAKAYTQLQPTTEAFDVHDYENDSDKGPTIQYRTVYGLVTTKGATAKNCKAFLVNFQQYNGHEWRTVDTMRGPVRLQWYTEDARADPADGIDIPDSLVNRFRIYESTHHMRQDSARSSCRQSL
ncbi:MAG: hypothetical protein Q9211_006855 [Gyalolechia sp. 1 TL-2023]